MWGCACYSWSLRGFSGGSVVKNLPDNARRYRRQFWSLRWEDPLEEEMTTNSSILAWRTPWTEEPGGLQFIVSHRVGHDWSSWACTHDCFANEYSVAQMVKNPPVMQKTWVWSLGGEDPVEKGMATYSSILAWRIPWTEEPGKLQFMGSTKSQTRLRDSHFHFQRDYMSIFVLIFWCNYK